MTGSWNLNIGVLRIEDQTLGMQTFATFQNIPITNNPGPVNPVNAKIFGSGLSREAEGTNALIMMQSRDDFMNTVSNPAGGLYIVQITSPAGVKS